MAATEDAGGAQSAGPTPDSGTAAQQHPGDTLSMPTLSAAQIPAPSSDRDAEASCDTKEPVEKQIKVSAAEMRVFERDRPSSSTALRMCTEA